ncbi:MAG TPA: class I SAM-dependent methyltransferase [Thermoplasmata archaeon]|nr:class I SAM-dependent methyltransferase [Thermoplasmata archaeon]
MRRRKVPLRVDTLPAEARSAVERARRALGDRRATPNLEWLAELTGARRPEIARTMAELERLLPLEEEIRHRHLAAGRGSYAQIRAPFELYALVRLLRPERIVETGVSSGVSSAHFLAALRRNHTGRLYSIDLPTRQRGPTLRADESPVSLPPGCDTGWSVPAALRDRWVLRTGPSQTLLPALVGEIGPIGLFLHDDLHTPGHLTFELETIRPRLGPGAVVLADNTSWTGDAFPKFARAVGARVARRGRGDLVGLRLPDRPPEL